MELLEYITKCSQLDYISDLLLDLEWKEVVSNIDPTMFPVCDWNEAVHYLCNTYISFSTAELARAYLLKY